MIPKKQEQSVKRVSNKREALKKKEPITKKKKKVKRLNTENLSITHAKSMNWLIDKTERWIPYAKIKKDLFGFIDLLAIDPEYNIYGIQATSYSNLNARVNKILTHENYERVKNSKIQITVWAWKKKVTKGRTEYKLIVKNL